MHFVGKYRGHAPARVCLNGIYSVLITCRLMKATCLLRLKLYCKRSTNWIHAHISKWPGSHLKKLDKVVQTVMNRSDTGHKWAKKLTSACSLNIAIVCCQGGDDQISCREETYKALIWPWDISTTRPALLEGCEGGMGFDKILSTSMSLSIPLIGLVLYWFFINPET